MKELQLGRKEMMLIALALTVMNWCTFAMRVKGKIVFLILTGVITLAFYYAADCIPTFIAVVLAVARVGAVLGSALGALTAWMMGIGIFIMIIAKVAAVLFVGYAGALMAYFLPILMYPVLSWLGKHLYGRNKKTYTVRFGEKEEQSNSNDEKIDWNGVYGKVVNKIQNDRESVKEAE